MQRWSALALLGVLVASAVLLFLRVGPAAPTPPAPSASAAASASAAPPLDSALAPALQAPPSLDLPADLAALAPAEDAENKGAGSLLPGGEAVPPLPAGAPKSVVFGVVLVEYRGAQGATPKARARDAAESLARTLADEARRDFAAAVKKGDPGSAENAGAMPRGVLEPGPEHVLFTLEVGDVGGPIDTPRGFWVVKRLE
jgi:hypothetical protein